MESYGPLPRGPPRRSGDSTAARRRAARDTLGHTLAAAFQSEPVIPPGLRLPPLIDARDRPGSGFGSGHVRASRYAPAQEHEPQRSRIAARAHSGTSPPTRRGRFDFNPLGASAPVSSGVDTMGTATPTAAHTFAPRAPSFRRTPRSSVGAFDEAAPSSGLPPSRGGARRPDPSTMAR
jgi:hypothetical protein